MTIINNTNPLNPIAQLPDPTDFPQARIRVGVYQAQSPSSQGYVQGQPTPPNDTPPIAPYMLTANYDTVWVIAQRWENFQGVLQMPVAGPPYVTPSSVVQTHSPYSTRVVSWAAARFGQWPYCPSPYSNDYPNQTLRYYSITPAAPTFGPDSRKYFRVSGIYVYVLKQSLAGVEVLPAGKLPFDNVPTPGLDQTQFVYNLLGAPT